MNKDLLIHKRIFLCDIRYNSLENCYALSNGSELHRLDVIGFVVSICKRSQFISFDCKYFKEDFYLNFKNSLNYSGRFHWKSFLYLFYQRRRQH